MATTADRLALLQRTKAGQRALLEEMSPDMDFSTVPFREYGRLFTGRKYVPGFVGGWKAYGRSNSEDASTRDILPDYSGNGRDISLYNFAFEGMSGYGGYVCDFNEFEVSSGVTGLTLTKSATKIRIEVTGEFNYANAINMQSKLWDATKGRTVKVTSTYTDIDSIQLQYSSQGTYQDIALNGTTFIPAYSGTVDTYIYIRLTNVRSKAGVIDIELLPEYPGALVSDGVDDYGQCVKDFALPDDYTIVAIRRRLGGSSVLAGKSHNSKNGAFLFEHSNLTYNYGISTGVTGHVPELFSYQTKTSYNGVELNVGSGTDTEADKFMLFMMRPGADKWSAYALYDLRLYDHSLTAEELEAVRDEMMADFEEATGGGISDIHYVLDLDAKGRSNDEEEPMRSTWTDKATGKVVDLHNFAFSGMSGWGGFRFDWSGWASDINGNGGEVVREKNKITVKNFGNYPGWAIAYSLSASFESCWIKISGLTSGKSIIFRSNNGEAGGSINYLTVRQDGIYELNPESGYVGLFISGSGFSNNEAAKLVIEQLPLYPGALVSDGVDDYGLSREALNENIGTVLAMFNLLGRSYVWSYLFDCTQKTEDLNRIFVAYNGNLEQPHNWIIGNGFSPNVLPLNYHQIRIETFTRSPISPAATISVHGSARTTGVPSSFSITALYRLIMIEEQLNGAQFEFLKWKVDKEHRDWCRANGYDYALTAAK